jgi:adenine deaminase
MILNAGAAIVKRKNPGDLMKQLDLLKKLIRVAQGCRESDLLLKGGSVINVFPHEIIGSFA